MTRTELNQLPATEALRLAGFGHRRTTRSLAPYDHDIFCLITGGVVATMSAHDAHDFAARHLRIED